MVVMVVVVATNVVIALLVSTQWRGDQHFLPLLPCFLLTFFFPVILNNRKCEKHFSKNISRLKGNSTLRWGNLFQR